MDTVEDVKHRLDRVEDDVKSVTEKVAEMEGRLISEDDRRSQTESLVATLQKSYIDLTTQLSALVAKFDRYIEVIDKHDKALEENTKQLRELKYKPVNDLYKNVNKVRDEVFKWALPFALGFLSLAIGQYILSLISQGV